MNVESTTDIGSRITGAIQDAARATGAGFDYLLKTALRESGFDPNSKASTSSATGLFQFIDQTWLATVKESGPQLGYAGYADQIVKTSSGDYVVPDAAARRQVMKLRYDPKANAAMAGAFTQRNAAELTSALGRQPTNGELYIAHVLGRGGATRLINATAKNPQAKAADLFPGAARANPSIFYNRQGTARSVSEVYDVLSSKMNGTTPMIAAPAPAAPAPAAPPAPALAVIAAATSGGAPGAADASTAVPPPPAAPAATAFASDNTPMFQDLFRTRREPVSPVVAELWTGTGTRTDIAPVTPTSGTTAPTSAPGRLGKPLDLFQFLRPEIRRQAAKVT
jgi:hypothetical protein